MPDRQSIDWCRRIEAVSSAAGLHLPREVVDELASHLADVYQSECDAGRSDEDAMAVAERLLRDVSGSARDPSRHIASNQAHRTGAGAGQHMGG